MSHPYPICVSLTLPQFIDTVTAIVQFNADNFRTGNPKGEPDVPEEYVMNVSYVVACWLAQRLDTGVETEAPAIFLKMEKQMSWDERRTLVEAFYREVDGWH